MALKRLLLALLLFITANTVSAARFDHHIWDGLLREHVYMINQGRASQVNYYGFALNHGVLQTYYPNSQHSRKVTFQTGANQNNWLS